jgi:lipopolysaccharide export system protein LptC
MARPLFSRPTAWLAILVMLTFWLDRILQQPGLQQEDDVQQGIDYIIENLEGIQVNHEQAANRFFSADTLIHYPEGDITHLEQVSFTSIEPDKPLLRVTSDHAELVEGSNDIFLTGNVSVIRGEDLDKDKVTMLTTFLHLTPDTDVAKTDQPVTVTRMNSVVNAVGLILNNQTGEILLQSRVNARDERTPH